MDLLTPSTGLLLWTVIFIVSLVVGLSIVFKVWKREDFDQTTKLLWTLLIICAPILSILLFLIFGRNQKTIVSK